MDIFELSKIKMEGKGGGGVNDDDITMYFSGNKEYINDVRIILKNKKKKWKNMYK